MNAVEFVKKFGVEEAIKVINLFPNSTLINIGGSCVSVSDLKQIVEAWELVDSYGGLEVAKTCEYSEDLDHAKCNIDLAKAINLVEKCND